MRGSTACRRGETYGEKIAAVGFRHSRWARVQLFPLRRRASGRRLGRQYLEVMEGYGKAAQIRRLIFRPEKEHFCDGKLVVSRALLSPVVLYKIFI